MSRYCDITCRTVTIGRNVSHAHNITPRFFRVNIRKLMYHSEVLGKVPLYVSAKGIRTVEKYGGLDSYLKNAKYLTARCLKLRNTLIEAECKKCSE